MTNKPEPNTRPLPQPSELVERLERHQSNLCRAICPHYTEQNWPHDPDCQTVSDAIAQLAKLQADGDKLAGALEAFQRHYDLNDCDERCGALEVPISDLRRARQALAAKGDSRG